VRGGRRRLDLLRAAGRRAHRHALPLRPLPDPVGQEMPLRDPPRALRRRPGL